MRQEGRLYPGEGQEIVQDISARLAGEALPSVDALRRTGSQPKNNSRRKIGPQVELELATILGKEKMSDLSWEDLRKEIYSAIRHKKARRAKSDLWESPRLEKIGRRVVEEIRTRFLCAESSISMQMEVLEVSMSRQRVLYRIQPLDPLLVSIFSDFAVTEATNLAAVEVGLMQMEWTQRKNCVHSAISPNPASSISQISSLHCSGTFRRAMMRYIQPIKAAAAERLAQLHAEHAELIQSMGTSNKAIAITLLDCNSNLALKAELLQAGIAAFVTAEEHKSGWIHCGALCIKAPAEFQQDMRIRVNNLMRAKVNVFGMVYAHSTFSQLAVPVSQSAKKKKTAAQVATTKKGARTKKRKKIAQATSTEMEQNYKKLPRPRKNKVVGITTQVLWQVKGKGEGAYVIEMGRSKVDSLRQYREKAEAEAEAEAKRKAGAGKSMGKGRGKGRGIRVGMITLAQAKAKWDSGVEMEYALNQKVEPYSHKDGAKFAKLCFFNPNYSLLQQTALESMDGITTPMDYFGAAGTVFAWHCEDQDLHSINYNISGADKVWWVIPAHQARLFEEFVSALKLKLKSQLVNATEALQMKKLFLTKKFLNERAPHITVIEVFQPAGTMMITAAGAYHAGFNTGFNAARSMNFSTCLSIDYALVAKARGSGSKKWDWEGGDWPAWTAATATAAATTAS
eukprot:g1635.t1